MAKYSKGERTKRNIVRQVNRLFNEKEMFLTWDEMAAELNLSRSRITNYFPKKELLILAIYQQFEEKLNAFFQEYQIESKALNHSELKAYYSNIMDLLFDFRFAISYVLVNPMNDWELRKHIDKTYEINKIKLRERVEKLIQAGIIERKLLTEKHFDPFNFQHTNLLTTWVISYRLYDQKMGYKKMKPIYLKGILLCYFPFLTDEGKKQMKALYED